MGFIKRLLAKIFKNKIVELRRDFNDTICKDYPDHHVKGYLSVESHHKDESNKDSKNVIKEEDTVESLIKEILSHKFN